MVNVMSEDIKVLEEWLKQAKDLICEISSKAKKNKVHSIFTISSTAKVPEKSYPFLTPLRQTFHSVIAGAVVFSQTQGILLCSRIDGLVDEVFVDAEKKIGMSFGLNEEVIRHFNLSLPDSSFCRNYVELGNLSHPCSLHIKKSKFQEFKSNDLAVEAVCHFLSNRFRVLSGKKIAIIGSGNIGFKIALKLVESGCTVDIVRRDISEGMLMANAIIIIKPASTLAVAHFNPNPIQASLYCDALIGSSNGIPVITWEMVQSMKPDGIILDVGKGTICEDAIEKALNSDVEIIRCDVSSAIDGFITATRRSRLIMENETGRNQIEEGIFIVSGGYMGHMDDIVVDNYSSPTRVIGVADGCGDFKKELTEGNRRDIEALNDRIDKLKKLEN